MADKTNIGDVSFKISADDSEGLLKLQNIERKALEAEERIRKSERATLASQKNLERLQRSGLSKIQAEGVVRLRNEVRAVKEAEAQKLAVIKRAQDAGLISAKQFAKGRVNIARQSQNEIKKLQTGGLYEPPDFKISAAKAIAGAFGVKKLTESFIELAREGGEAEQTMDGLSRVISAKLGPEAIEPTKKALDSLTASGLLNQSDAQSAIKNLVAVGFSLEETTKLIQRNTDIAISSRQAGLSVSEAVVRFTDGVKNQNSTLTDSTGITTNLSVILGRYGLKMQDLDDKTKSASARAALFKEVMKETAAFVGAADSKAEKFVGQLARVDSVTTKLRVSFGQFIGQALAPVIGLWADFVTWVERSFSRLQDSSKAIVAISIAMGGMLLVIPPLLSGLKGVILSMQAMAVASTLSAGKIGLLIAALALATAAAVKINESVQNQKDSENTITRLRALNKEIAEATGEKRLKLLKEQADLLKAIPEPFRDQLTFIEKSNDAIERQIELLSDVKEAGKLSAEERVAEIAKIENTLNVKLKRIKKVAQDIKSTEDAGAKANFKKFELNELSSEIYDLRNRLKLLRSFENKDTTGTGLLPDKKGAPIGGPGSKAPKESDFLLGNIAKEIKSLNKAYEDFQIVNEKNISELEKGQAKFLELRKQIIGDALTEFENSLKVGLDSQLAGLKAQEEIERRRLVDIKQGQEKVLSDQRAFFGESFLNQKTFDSEIERISAEHNERIKQLQEKTNREILEAQLKNAEQQISAIGEVSQAALKLSKGGSVGESVSNTGALAGAAGSGATAIGATSAAAGLGVFAAGAAVVGGLFSFFASEADEAAAKEKARQEKIEREKEEAFQREVQRQQGLADFYRINVEFERRILQLARDRRALELRIARLTVESETESIKIEQGQIEQGIKDSLKGIQGRGQSVFAAGSVVQDSELVDGIGQTFQAAALSSASASELKGGGGAAGDRGATAAELKILRNGGINERIAVLNAIEDRQDKAKRARDALRALLSSGNSLEAGKFLNENRGSFSESEIFAYGKALGLVVNSDGSFRTNAPLDVNGNPVITASGQTVAQAEAEDRKQLEKSLPGLFNIFDKSDTDAGLQADLITNLRSDIVASAELEARTAIQKFRDDIQTAERGGEVIGLQQGQPAATSFVNSELEKVANNIATNLGVQIGNLPEQFAGTVGEKEQFDLMIELLKRIGFDTGSMSDSLSQLTLADDKTISIADVASNLIRSAGRVIPSASINLPEGTVQAANLFTGIEKNRSESTLQSIDSTLKDIRLILLAIKQINANTGVSADLELKVSQLNAKILGRLVA